MKKRNKEKVRWLRIKEIVKKAKGHDKEGEKKNRGEGDSVEE